MGRLKAVDANILVAVSDLNREVLREALEYQVGTGVRGLERGPLELPSDENEFGSA